MKKMKSVFSIPKKAIVAAAITATVSGYANNNNSKSIKDDKITAITLNVKQGNLLTIKDANGIILYKEIMEQKGVYSKGFDLTALPNGNYVIELEKDVEIKVMPFTVSSTKVSFNKESESVFFKPVTRVKEDLVYVTKLALNNEDLDIEIYKEADHYSFDYFNINYELVYKEKVKNTKSLERIYKLSKKGNYKIVYYSQGRTHTEYINN
ncbi:hypothetical protein JCM19301_4025 [Jejuia pallidilutea]|uniref:Secreted protein (Por secretion system target) n=2 Tax=Jejuia pallidilutea TaxID=504487 RepID=A0A090W3V2_9FLAO|nr:hypothetical protein JCM19301_4025 [Jejuia pallidilutea]GAL70129.1 hypothetical protein JCM19302_2704 [Jejuia pallidilutea]GAL88895.1 hypothetical protein JCM19538_1884 [Jejuia pallidilutea]